MKFSPPCTTLCWVTMMLVVWQQQEEEVSAFTTIPDVAATATADRSLLLSRRLWMTSVSTMNLLEEDDDEEEQEASTTPPRSSTSQSPLAASTVSVPPATTATATATANTSLNVDWDWQELAASVFTEEEQRPIVLFDGVCNLCNGGVNFAMDCDPKAKLRFCSLHSKVAQSLLLQAGQEITETPNQIVLVTAQGQSYFSSDAVARICQHLDGLPPLQWVGHAGQYVPEWIRESLYRFVSKHRYKFGENDSCRLDFDGTLTSRFVSDPVEIADV